MLVTCSDGQQPKPSKIILSTNQAYQISQLIKEYIEVVFEQPNDENGEGQSTAENGTDNCRL